MIMDSGGSGGGGGGDRKRALEESATDDFGSQQNVRRARRKPHAGALTLRQGRSQRRRNERDQAPPVRAPQQPPHTLHCRNLPDVYVLESSAAATSFQESQELGRQSFAESDINTAASGMYQTMDMARPPAAAAATTQTFQRSQEVGGQSAMAAIAAKRAMEYNERYNLVNQIEEIIMRQKMAEEAAQAALAATAEVPAATPTQSTLMENHGRESVMAVGNSNRDEESLVPRYSSIQGAQSQINNMAASAPAFQESGATAMNVAIELLESTLMEDSDDELALMERFSGAELESILFDYMKILGGESPTKAVNINNQAEASSSSRSSLAEESAVAAAFRESEAATSAVGSRMLANTSLGRQAAEEATSFEENEFLNKKEKAVDNSKLD